MPAQDPRAIPPASASHYGLAMRAARIIDLRMNHKGVLTVTKREPDATGVWREVGSAGTFTAKKNRPIKFKITVADGQWALISVQAEDWPFGYEDPHFMTLGLLDPVGGFGQEIPMGTQNPRAELTTSLFGSLNDQGVLQHTIYGKRVVLKNGKPVLGANNQPMMKENAEPTSSTTVDIKRLWDPTMVVGTAHMTIRLTDIPQPANQPAFQNKAVVSINDGQPFGYV